LKTRNRPAKYYEKQKTQKYLKRKTRNTIKNRKWHNRLCGRSPGGVTTTGGSEGKSAIKRFYIVLLRNKKTLQQIFYYNAYKTLPTKRKQLYTRPHQKKKVKNHKNSNEYEWIKRNAHKNCYAH